MTCLITIYGPQSKLTSDTALDSFVVTEVRKATSYPVEGAQFSKAYKQKKWDGRKHLFNKRTGAFPTGLVATVKTALEKAGQVVEIKDERLVPEPLGNTFDLKGINFAYPYDFQLDACRALIAARQGILKVATGGGKSAMACAVTKYIGRKTLFLVTSSELLYQARRVFSTFLGLPEQQVGIIGDSEWAPSEFVTIGMTQTLESRLNEKYCTEFLKSIDVLFLDECHNAGAETVFTVTTLCGAYYRYGLSATPLDRTDGANLRLLATTGEIAYEITNKELVERGVINRAHIIFDKVTEPVLPKKSTYPTAYKEGVVHNTQLLSKVVEWATIFKRQNVSTVILCEEIAHGKAIDDALWTDATEFIPHQFIHGEESTEVRQEALDRFKKGEIPVLVSSTILDVGVDLPNIDALILAGSKKSKIRTMQRLGRGLRGKRLIAVEFANFCHKYLLEHAHKRLQDYKNEDCFPIHYSGPDEELVKKILKEFG